MAELALVDTKTLRNLTEDQLKLRAILSDPDLDDASREAALEALEDVGDATDSKLRGYTIVALSIKDDLDAVKAEISRLGVLKKRYENEYGGLEYRARASMQALDMKTFKDPQYPITLRDKPLSVQVEDQDALPLEFLETKVVQSAMKDVIGKVLKAAVEYNRISTAPAMDEDERNAELELVLKPFEEWAHPYIKGDEVLEGAVLKRGEPSIKFG
jgi:hypothetical protein